MNVLLKVSKRSKSAVSESSIKKKFIDAKNVQKVKNADKLEEKDVNKMLINII